MQVNGWVFAVKARCATSFLFLWGTFTLELELERKTAKEQSCKTNVKKAPYLGLPTSRVLVNSYTPSQSSHLAMQL